MKQANVQRSLPPLFSLRAIIQVLQKREGTLFHHIRKHGIEPRHQHYARVVDLLSLAGYSNHASNFFMNMPIEARLCAHF